MRKFSFLFCKILQFRVNELSVKMRKQCEISAKSFVAASINCAKKLVEFSAFYCIIINIFFFRRSFLLKFSHFVFQNIFAFFFRKIFAFFRAIFRIFYFAKKIKAKFHEKGEHFSRAKSEQTDRQAKYIYANKL